MYIANLIQRPTLDMGLDKAIKQVFKGKEKSLARCICRCALERFEHSPKEYTSTTPMLTIGSLSLTKAEHQDLWRTQQIFETRGLFALLDADTILNPKPEHSDYEVIYKAGTNPDGLLARRHCMNLQNHVHRYLPIVCALPNQGIPRSSEPRNDPIGQTTAT